jgi:predicted ATPase with chaperone activity
VPRVLSAVLRGLHAELAEVESGEPGTAHGLAAAVARRVAADVPGVMFFAGLDPAGVLLPVRGVACAVLAAQERSLCAIVAPTNGAEAAAVAGADVRQADAL